jgi:hypothetical protein
MAPDGGIIAVAFKGDSPFVDDGGSFPGLVRIYGDNGFAEWELSDTLEGELGWSFGESISFSVLPVNRIAVGAPTYDSTGRVIVYEQTPGSAFLEWNFWDGDSLNEEFGGSVLLLDDDRLAVGSPGYNIGGRVQLFSVT